MIYALNESNNAIVDSRTELIEMGSMNSDALKVIADKDFALFENAAYIDTCHSRIADLDLLVSQLGFLPDKVADLERRLSFSSEQLSSSAEYIAECEGRILNLEFSLSGFSALRSQFEKVNAVLKVKDADIASNVEYIARLHERIAELENALVDFNALRSRISEIEGELKYKESDADDRDNYIALCHERISELDDLFARQRSNYHSALDSISQLEKRLSLRNEEFLSVVEELDALRNRINALLNWKIIRMIDNRMGSGGAVND